MPFDGVAVRALAHELKDRISDSRIERISMPSRNEVVLSLRKYGKNIRLYISVNPSAPAVFIADEVPSNPPVPPNFCMFLRKHIGGGIIRDVANYGFERYFSITIDTRSSLGDMVERKLMIELTGRNCNLILLNESDVILDAVRHVDATVSSVREVMPARIYTFLPSQNKQSPDEAVAEKIIENQDLPAEKVILYGLTGFSPVLCREVCHRASVDPDMRVSAMSPASIQGFRKTLNGFLREITGYFMAPCIVRDASGKYRDFHCVTLSMYPGSIKFNNFNEVLSTYFLRKRKTEKTTVGKSDLIKAVKKNMDRCKKKIALHSGIIGREDGLADLRLYGELITANIHLIKPGFDSIDVLNYYDGTTVNIKLDPNKDAAGNAQRYYKKYKKTKSAIENSELQLKDAMDELSYLESVSHWLNSVEDPKEASEIRRELAAQGYIKKKHPKYKKKEETPRFRPHKYISSEGYEIFAGRNNYENDYLTFKFANSRDLWLHAKGIPGSHVIVRKKDRKLDLFPDTTITEAASIAVYHSKAKNSGKTAVDYSEVRNIKKPSGAKPGMVNYFDYFSTYALPDEELIKKLKAE